MAISRSLLIRLLLLISIAALTSCATKNTEIVYSSLAPHPESLGGAMVIATNDKIRVTSGDAVDNKDLGGYVAMHSLEVDAMNAENVRLRKLLSKGNSQ